MVGNSVSVATTVRFDAIPFIELTRTRYAGFHCRVSRFGLSRECSCDRMILERLTGAVRKTHRDMPIPVEFENALRRASHHPEDANVYSHAGTPVLFIADGARDSQWQQVVGTEAQKSPQSGLKNF